MGNKDIAGGIIYQINKERNGHFMGDCAGDKCPHWITRQVDIITKALFTVRAEEQKNFVNDITAVLDADDVEQFTALLMKAKASPDLTSETRSALKSEAEIRAEERKAAFKEVIGMVASLPTQGTMNYRRGYEEGVRDALRTLEAENRKGCPEPNSDSTQATHSATGDVSA